MWKMVKLDEVCLVRRGTTITKKETVVGDIPVIGGGTKPTYFHNKPNRSAGVISVSGSGASAGFVNYWDTPIFASDCSTVEPKSVMHDRRFLYFYLLSHQHYIYDNFRRADAAQPHVYAKDIANLQYPLLSLGEQQRIVAKLDTVFAEIDYSIGVAECKLGQVDKLKNALLSTELSVTSNYVDTRMWKVVKLDEVCLVRRGTTITKKETVDGDIPVIGGGKKPTYFHNKPNRDAGVISVSGSGASAGFVNYWDTPVFASDCSTVEPKSVMHDRRFLYFYLLSHQHYIYDNFRRADAAQPHVYAKDIANLQYPLLSLDEQQRIVAKLDAAFEQADVLTANVQKQFSEYQSLKSALLKDLLTSEAA